MKNQLLLLSCSVSVLVRAGDEAINTSTGDQLGAVSFPHLLRPGHTSLLSAACIFSNRAATFLHIQRPTAKRTCSGKRICCPYERNHGRIAVPRGNAKELRNE
jgi:hypothetical protein